MGSVSTYEVEAQVSETFVEYPLHILPALWCNFKSQGEGWSRDRCHDVQMQLLRLPISSEVSHAVSRESKTQTSM